tara:strand:+ start:520 stop:960 length:441 start_codon:yes stop_codon:yes gene_type:complete
VEGKLFKIVDAPIASDALYEEVLKDYNGAVVTFCGVVRDHSGETTTDFLVYDAYKKMAEKKMSEIGDQAKEKWNIEDVAILHRIGRLEIGEISVLIAVASPHRAEAFDACRFIIDKLKETVPIWKKEVGQNGEAWVEGPQAAFAGG